MERLGAAEWVQVFDLFTDGKIPREAIQPVAAHMAENPGVDAAAASATLGYALQDRAAWTRELSGLSTNDDCIAGGDSEGKRLHYLVGKAVRQLRGKAPAKEVAEFVRTQLGQEVLQ